MVLWSRRFGLNLFALLSYTVRHLKASSTPHVAIGTFTPLRSEGPAKHVLKRERYHVSTETATPLNAATHQETRIIPAGRTPDPTAEDVSPSSSGE